MKIKYVIAVGTALLVTASVAKAAHIWEDPNNWTASHFTFTSAGPLFTAQELSLDLFGTYTAGERHLSKLFETNIRHGQWGGGVGLNYFFTRELGISGDIEMGDNRGNFVDQALGSLIARWPIGCFAPYIFGGGGRGFDPQWEWLGTFGVGAEFRLNPGTGIFIDSRYVWADKSSDRILFRAGLRVVF